MTYTADGRTIRLGEQLGTPGGEGTAYRVAAEPGLVAKVYHAPPTATTQAKIAWMIRNPPAGADGRAGHPPLAWPRALLHRGPDVVGYLMPLVDHSSAAALYHLIDPPLRAKFARADQRPFSWKNVHQIAGNLAQIIARCHAEGYVVGDLNTKNILVHRSGQVTLIDNDSFQVTTDRATYRCGVIRPDFAPPELLNVDLQATDRTAAQDNYILAILIFMLLQDGRHPFLGHCPGEPDPIAPVDLAARGWYPYDQTRARPEVAPHPLMPPLARLHPALTSRFQQCFTVGLRDPARRPAAGEWAAALAVAGGSVTRCGRNHEYTSYPGGLCLTKFTRGYCGSTAGYRSPRPLAFAAVDALTGVRGGATAGPAPAVTAATYPAATIVMLIAQTRLRARLQTVSGAKIPATTVIELHDQRNAVLQSQTIGGGATAERVVDFGTLPVGTYSLVVRQAAGFTDFRHPFHLDAALGSVVEIPLRLRSRSLVKQVVRLTIAADPSDPLDPGTTVHLVIDGGAGTPAFQGSVVVTPAGTADQVLSLAPDTYHATVDVPGRPVWQAPLTITSGVKHLTLRLPGSAPVQTPPPMPAAAGGSLAPAVVRVVPPAGRGFPAGGTFAVVDAVGRIVDAGPLPTSGAFPFVSAPGTYTITLSVPGFPDRHHRAHFTFAAPETVVVPLAPAGPALAPPMLAPRVVRRVLAGALGAGLLGLQVANGLPLTLAEQAIARLGAGWSAGPAGPVSDAALAPGPDAGPVSTGDEAAPLGLGFATAADARPAFPGATGHLATAWRTTAGTSAIIVYDLATSQQVTTVTPPAGAAQLGAVRLAPDGATLAYVVESADAGAGATSEVLLQSLADRLTPPTSLVRLEPGARVADLSWNAAGTQVFVSITDATGPWVLGVTAATGEASEFTPPSSSHPTFSGDGLAAAYVVPDRGSADIVFGDATGLARFYVMITPDHDEGTPQFSPDGLAIAFDRAEIATGQHEAVIWSQVTNADRVIAGQSNRPTRPVWSPDGRFVAIIRDGPTGRVAEVLEAGTLTPIIALDAAHLESWSWRP